ncbi:MAG TPA: ATP-binding protein, partial [Longimicrobiales bacterium]
TTEQQKEFLGRIRLSTLHLMSLIEEILTFSRIEAGKETLMPDPCDLVALAQEAVALVEPQALHKGLALTLSAPEEMPVVSDPRKVRQVLINLLGNAVKFTDSGSVRLEVFLEGDHACYRITDTGPGILPDQLERIFEAFTQADQTMTRMKGGTGLGLAVSRKLVEMLGGELSVQSAVGEGSIFTVRLPLDLPENGNGPPG